MQLILNLLRSTPSMHWMVARSRARDRGVEFDPGFSWWSRTTAQASPKQFAIGCSSRS